MANKKKEFKGKNIDEAIALACDDFKASQNELDIEVITTGSAGIFGFGKKKAVILVSRKKASVHELEDGAAELLAKEKLHQGRKIKGPGHSDMESREERGARKEKPWRNEVRKEASLDVAVEKQKGTSRGGTKQDRGGNAKFDSAPVNPPTQVALAEIKALTGDLLRLMGLEAEVTLSVEGHKVVVHILAGEHNDVIVGRDGSTLDALQYLLRKIVSQKFPEKISLSLDAGTYRHDRQKELEQLALELAQKVKETGKSQMISALNPAERRMVHVTLQNDTTIRSASIGEGLFKKVRIYLPGKGRKKSDQGEGDSSGRED